MRYIDKVIKGEGNFSAFMDTFRPGWRDIRRVENIWRFYDVTVERFYSKRYDEEYYSEWFWLVMPSQNDEKGFTQVSDRRKEIYEGIRTGKITGKV